MISDVIRHLAAAGIALAGGAGLFSGTAQAATIRADVLVDDANFTDLPSAFSFPRITFLNLSDPGFDITGIAITGGFIDWIDSVTLVNPAGGTSTPTGGTQVIAVDANDGCSSVSFGLTGFGPAESFAFRVDPETSACGSAVVDWRSRLDPDEVGASATFTGPGIAGEMALSGSDWTMELKDPQGGNGFPNQQYRLTLTATIADQPTSTPEPATMALLGAGILGLGLLRRRA